MPYIYTISHPFTNEVVYVGATYNLQSRNRTHVNAKNGSPICEWVQNLLSNFMLPKFEVLEVVSMEDMADCETFWIEQLRSFGFNLLNINKNISKPKFKIVKGEKIKREPKIHEFLGNSLWGLGKISHKCLMNKINNYGDIHQVIKDFSA